MCGVRSIHPVLVNAGCKADTHQVAEEWLGAVLEEVCPGQCRPVPREVHRIADGGGEVHEQRLLPALRLVAQNGMVKQKLPNV